MLRVPDAAIAQCHKYGGAEIGFQAPWTVALPDESFETFAANARRAERIFATQVDYRGLKVLGFAPTWSGNRFHVTVGLTEAGAAEWDSRGISPLLAWWDGIFRKDQRHFFHLESV
jgi:hypothetical protein